MTGVGEQRLARAALTYLAEPGDTALGAPLGICEPADVLAAIKADLLPAIGPGCGDSPASRKALERALGRWRARLPGLPDEPVVSFEHCHLLCRMVFDRHRLARWESSWAAVGSGRTSRR